VRMPRSGQHLAEPLERVELLALRVELEGEADTVAARDVCHLGHARHGLGEIAASAVDGAHHRPAAERGGPAARLVEGPKEAGALLTGSEHPAQFHSDTGSGQPGAAHEVEHGGSRLPSLRRAREVQAAKLHGRPARVAHDLQHARQRSGVEGPGVKGERVGHAASADEEIRVP